MNNKTLKIAVVVSAIAGLAFNVVGEPLFSYFYNSVIISSILYIAIQPKLKHNGTIEKLAPKYE